MAQITTCDVCGKSAHKSLTIDSQIYDLCTLCFPYDLISKLLGKGRSVLLAPANPWVFPGSSDIWVPLTVPNQPYTITWGTNTCKSEYVQ